METKETNIKERIRKNTPEETNRQIDQQTKSNIKVSRKLSNKEITSRLEELQKEWEMERVLVVNAATISLSSLVLGALVDRRWFVLSGIVAGFLLQHGLQGWCPPLPIFRSMGYRSRKEIDEEIYALKVMRGDFDGLTSSSQPEEIINKFRK